jgi:hypothetical protein
MLLIAERLLKKRLPPKSSVKMLEPSELKDAVFDLFVGDPVQRSIAFC